uniref:FH2 domain-containing protein n=1 Tax=Lotharella globosa TaxID=91324 RepID=A0A7S3YR84_9EUKA
MLVLCCALLPCFSPHRFIESEIKQISQSLSVFKVCVTEASKTNRPYPDKAKDFVKYAEERFNKISEDQATCHREFSEACQYFGEKEGAWEEFFETWFEFLSEYQRAEIDVARAIANERRMARRALEEKKRKEEKKQRRRRASEAAIRKTSTRIASSARAGRPGSNSDAPASAASKLASKLELEAFGSL